MILQTKNLSIGYQNKKSKTCIASGINLKLHKAELIGVIGVNGVGKSTLLQSICATIPLLDGEILLHQKPLQNYSSMMLAKDISVVFTEKLATKNISVFELVALGRHPYTNWLGQLAKTDKAIILKALENTQTLDLKHRNCNTLSDGQLQRVLLARALAQQTDLIVLDEPTSHLDLYHSVQTIRLLRELSHKEHKSFLFSTHQIDIAIQLCDKILILKKENSFFDTPEHLIQQGAFNDLFPGDVLQFDPIKQGFKVNYTTTTDKHTI